MQYFLEVENFPGSTLQQLEFWSRIMEEDDRGGRKRSRDDGSPTSEHSEPAGIPSADSILEHSLKKVRISKQFPGGIRLQQDVGECTIRARELGIDLIKIDPKNPLHLLLRLSMGREFSLTVGKYYPHQPPTVTLLRGSRLTLPVLERWMPINTLTDIIIQLNSGDARQLEEDMDEK